MLGHCFSHRINASLYGRRTTWVVINDEVKVVTLKFEKDGHLIHWGDALETLRTEVASESVDLLFVDPPYNIGKKFANFHDRWPSDEDYAKWAYQWLDECIRVLKPTGTL